MMVCAHPGDSNGPACGNGKRKRDNDEDRDREDRSGWRFYGYLELDREEYEPAVVLVIGDSFIRRLQQFEHETYGNYHNLGLLFDVAHVNWIGRGGLTVPSLRSRYLGAIRTLAPDVVVIQVGSNDLCDPQNSAALVSADIQFLVQNLHSYGVAEVIICQVLNRHGNGVPDGISPQDYNLRVSNFNATTRAALSSYPSSRYWHHRGLWNNHCPVISRDGTHLNRFGNCLFYRSIRGAILHGVRRARRGLRRLPRQ